MRSSSAAMSSARAARHTQAGEMFFPRGELVIADFSSPRAGRNVPRRFRLGAFISKESLRTNPMMREYPFIGAIEKTSVTHTLIHSHPLKLRLGASRQSAASPQSRLAHLGTVRLLKVSHN